MGKIINMADAKSWQPKQMAFVHVPTWMADSGWVFLKEIREGLKEALVSSAVRAEDIPLDHTGMLRQHYLFYCTCD